MFSYLWHSLGQRDELEIDRIYHFYLDGVLVYRLFQSCHSRDELKRWVRGITGLRGVVVKSLDMCRPELAVKATSAARHQVIVCWDTL